jgi:hypothetical protein
MLIISFLSLLALSLLALNLIEGSKGYLLFSLYPLYKTLTYLKFSISINMEWFFKIDSQRDKGEIMTLIRQIRQIEHTMTICLLLGIVLTISGATYSTLVNNALPALIASLISSLIVFFGALNILSQQNRKKAKGANHED